MLTDSQIYDILGKIPDEVSDTGVFIPFARAVIAAYEAELRKQQEPVCIVGELSEPSRSDAINNKGLVIGQYLFTNPAPSAPEGWISVDDERKPRYGQHVAVLTTNVDDDPVAIMANYNGKKLFLSIGGKKVKPATHWIKLPEPPMAAARSDK
mgnify:CR=1 FL=1